MVDVADLHELRERCRHEYNAAAQRVREAQSELAEATQALFDSAESYGRVSAAYGIKAST